MQQEMDLSKFEFDGDGDKNVKNWKKIKQIGCGHFSHVYHAKAFTPDAEWDVAVKEINVKFDKKEKASKTATTETNALIKLSHERIVSYYGFSPQDFACFIFIEYMPLGSLCDYIQIKEVMREDRVHLFTKQLLEGIQYLHSQRVLHRDIKTGNILMSSKKSIKLTDFGLSKIFEEFSKASTTGVGTIRYMAPEMFSGSYSYPVDIWALGCVLVEMLTGDFPFSKLEGQQVMFALFKENTSPLKYVDQKLPDLAEQFLNKIFKYKPEERHSAGDLLQNDPYITKPYYNFQMKSNRMLYVRHCNKNPGHRDFIPVKDFTLQHLPEGLRDKDLYELIQVVAILTIRVSIEMVSDNRPKFHPNSMIPYPFYKMAANRNRRTGSGEIFALFHYVNGHTSDVNPNILIPQIDFRDETYKTCTCYRCHDSDSPSNEWYEIFATTNTINVFDETEARHTRCRLFYDVDDSPVVWVDKVSIVMVDVETGLCVIKIVTCDKALGEKLQEMCERKNVLMEQILKKYKNTTYKLCFIVSHPHGCSKHVTIGQWVDNVKRLDFNENIDLTRLTYTTATCPGSTGASVYCVGMKHAHNHQGGYLEPKRNQSGIGYYYKN